MFIVSVTKLDSNRIVGMRRYLIMVGKHCIKRTYLLNVSVFCCIESYNKNMFDLKSIFNQNGFKNSQTFLVLGCSHWPDGSHPKASCGPQAAS